MAALCMVTYSYDGAATTVTSFGNGALHGLGINSGMLLARKSVRLDRVLACTSARLRAVYDAHRTLQHEQNAFNDLVFEVSPVAVHRPMHRSSLSLRPEFASLRFAWLHPLWQCRLIPDMNPLCVFVHSRAAQPEAERLCRAPVRYDRAPPLVFTKRIIDLPPQHLWPPDERLTVDEEPDVSV